MRSSKGVGRHAEGSAWWYACENRMSIPYGGPLAWHSPYGACPIWSKPDTKASHHKAKKSRSITRSKTNIYQIRGWGRCRVSPFGAKIPYIFKQICVQKRSFSPHCDAPDLADLAGLQLSTVISPFLKGQEACPGYYMRYG